MMLRRRPTRRTRADDAGFSLVEVLVAALVLVLFSSGVATVITSTLGVTKVDRQRVAASGLAQRELAIARGLVTRSNASALALVATGTTVNPSPLGATASAPSVLDGVAYTITRTAAWAVRGSAASSCDGGIAVTYPNIIVKASVTWPGMRAVAPVTSSTHIAPPKNLLNTTYAFVAVAVKNYAGTGVAGRTVTVGGPASQVQTTDASGCAVFGLASSGTYTFTLNDAGWVDYSGSTLSSKTQTVTAGSFSKVDMTYDQAASLTVDAAAPTGGYALPQSAVDVGIYSQRLPPTAYSRTGPTSGGSGTFTTVAPWPDGYVGYAGSCSDANPVLPPTNASRTRTVAAPGAAPHVGVVLAPVHVQLSATATATLSGQTVTATSQAASCPAGQGTLTLGTTRADGSLDTSLPYGRWTVSAAGRTSPAFNPPASGATSSIVVS